MKPLLILLLSISLFSCKKSEHHYMAAGTVTGYDLSNCALCGGYIVKMNGNDTTFRFYHFPAGTTFDTTKFPININFDYHHVIPTWPYLLQLDAVSLAQ